MTTINLDLDHLAILRRRVLALGGSALAAVAALLMVPDALHASPKDAKAKLAELVGGRDIEKGHVHVTLPAFTERGPFTRIIVAVDSPMTEEAVMTVISHIKVPARARKGETVLLRAKLKHPMETGWRKNAAGETVARNRIHTFVCMLDGDEVLRADLHSGVSADPYFAFYVRAEKSGVFRFQWHEDGGAVYEKNAAMEVVD